jgi:hypothetical protein
LPSRFNGDHKRFYTPASLLTEVERALPVNGYRVRHLSDNDDDFDYQVPLDAPPSGACEIELVLERIARPSWADDVIYPPIIWETIKHLDAILCLAIAKTLSGVPDVPNQILPLLGSSRYFTPWARLQRHFVIDGAPELAGVRVTEPELTSAVSKYLQDITIDVDVYLKHQDLRDAFAAGRLPDPTAHWRAHGYFEGRIGHAPVGELTGGEQPIP